MNNSQEITDAVRESIENATKILAQSKISAFDDAGYQSYGQHIEEYAVELGKEAHRISRRQNATSITQFCVDRAGHHLTAFTSRRWQKQLGTIGGTLLGAALSSMLAILLEEEPNNSLMVVTMVIAIIGSACIAIHSVVDRS